ncbi:MAG: Gldg family protein [Alphaproteobacteria bacterium]|nr:Gldg family protein [Alphaproteobacteria bacterium]
MRQFFIQYLKEFKSNFANYNAYFIISAYYLISYFATIYLGNYFLRDTDATLSFFSLQPIILILIIPAITMRSWGDELKTGTIELLTTQPISYLKLVLAKFFGAFSFFLILVLLSIPFLIISFKLSIVDVGLIISNYVGLVLCGAFFTALGCLVSAFNKNNILCYIIAIFVLLIVTQVELSSFRGIPFQALNFDFHYNSFLSGFLYWSNVLYFVIATIVCIWINVFVFDYKKSSIKHSKLIFYSALGLIIGFYSLLLLGADFILYKPKDITSSKKFTISDVNKQFLENTDKRIDIILYESQNEREKINSGYAIYADYVERFLRLIEQTSNGAIRLQIIKVEAFSHLETRLIREKIPYKEDTFGNKIYMLADFSDNDGNMFRISSFNSLRQNLLESDIMRVIYGFGEAKKNIAILSYNDEIDRFTGFKNILDEFYNVNYTDFNVIFIPQKFDAVVIINPKFYSSEFLLAIEQYILNGGNLIIFMDPKLLNTSKAVPFIDFLKNYGIMPIAHSTIKNKIDNIVSTLGASNISDNYTQFKARSVIFNEAGKVDFKSFDNYNVQPVLTHNDDVIAVHSSGKYVSSFLSFITEDTEIIPSSKKDGNVYFFYDSDILNDFAYISDSLSSNNFYENIYQFDNPLFLLQVLDKATSRNIENKLDYKYFAINPSSIGNAIYSIVENNYKKKLEKLEKALDKTNKKKSNFTNVILTQGFASVKNIGDINEIEFSIDDTTNQINKLKSSIFADYQHIIISFTILIIFIVPIVFLLALGIFTMFYRKYKIRKIRRILNND